MLMKLVLLCAISSQAFGMLIKKVDDLKKRTENTIITGKDKKNQAIKKKNCLADWQSAWKNNVLELLADKRKAIQVFQDGDSNFPAREQAQTRLEFDGPRSDLTIGQNQQGYRVLVDCCC